MCNAGVTETETEKETLGDTGDININTNKFSL